MAHTCKCPKCGNSFDRDKVPTVKVGARRYGHTECYPDINDIIMPTIVVSEEKIALDNYIKNKFGNKANWAMIKKETKQFIDDGMTLSGILGTLTYWFDIKNNSIDKANGHLGIVPYIYKDAKEYFTKISNAENVNKNKEIREEVQEITIKPPVYKRFLRMFKLGDDE